MICGHAAAGSVLSPVCGSAEGVWRALVLQVVVERTVRPGLVPLPSVKPKGEEASRQGKKKGDERRRKEK